MTEVELKRRLAELKKLINNDDNVQWVNIKFVETAFKLMEDCGLITAENINFLTDARACARFDSALKFPFNPDEGALRQVTDYGDVLGADGLPRFYHGRKRRLDFNGRTYLFSNDWYADRSVCPNKRAFFNWLKEKAAAACQNNPAPPPTKPVDLNTVLKSLEELHKKVDHLTRQVETFNNIWK